MTLLRTSARLAPTLLLSAALLAACATPGAPTAPETTATSGRAWGEMAPIPNPDGEAAAPRSAPSAPRPAPQPQQEAAPAPREAAPAAPPARTGGGAAQAARLRTQGLTELNRGNVDSAVRLLRQAQGLDPANALIERDLQRALRISRAVRGAQ